MILNLPVLDDSVVGQHLPLSVAGQLPVSALVQAVDVSGGGGAPTLVVDVTVPGQPGNTGFSSVFGRIGLGLLGADYLDIAGFIACVAAPGPKVLAIDVSSVMPPGYQFYNSGDGVGTFVRFVGGIVDFTESVRVETYNAGASDGVQVTMFPPSVVALTSGDCAVFFRVLGRIGPV